MLPYRYPPQSKHVKPSNRGLYWEATPEPRCAFEMGESADDLTWHQEFIYFLLDISQHSFHIHSIHVPFMLHTCFIHIPLIACYSWHTYVFLKNSFSLLRFPRDSNLPTGARCWGWQRWSLQRRSRGPRFSRTDLSTTRCLSYPFACLSPAFLYPILLPSGMMAGTQRLAHPVHNSLLILSQRGVPGRIFLSQWFFIHFIYVFVKPFQGYV